MAKQVPLPLVGSTSSRNQTNTKDQVLVNCYLEVIKDPLGTENQKVFIKKRPGIAKIYGNDTDTSRGIFGWSVTNQIYMVNRSGSTSTAYYYNGSILTSLGTVTDGTTVCGFIEYETQAGVAYLLLSDGVKLWKISSSNVMTQVDPTETSWAATTVKTAGNIVVPTVYNGYKYICTVGGTTAGAQPTWPTTIGVTVVDGTVTWQCYAHYQTLPTPHVPMPVYMDGYLFLLKTTGEIYNNNILNLDDWDTTNFIVPESFPDTCIAIARQNNQLVALSTTSTEYFYNASNTTGSPLSPTKQYTKQYGTIAASTVCQNESLLIFVASSDAGGLFVVSDSGGQNEVLSDNFINRALFYELNTNNTTYMYSFLGRIDGHMHYFINTRNVTFVYDIENKHWYLWGMNYPDTDFGYTGTQYGIIGISTTVLNNYVYTTTYGDIHRLARGNLSDVVTATNTYTIPVIIRTSKFDADTNYNKFLNLCELHSDILDTGDSVKLTWSDDDFTTFATPRTLTTTDNRLFTTQLGSFRRRAFKIGHNSNNTFRAEKLILDIDLGNA